MSDQPAEPWVCSCGVLVNPSEVADHVAGHSVLAQSMSIRRESERANEARRIDPGEGARPDGLRATIEQRRGRDVVAEVKPDA